MGDIKNNFYMRKVVEITENGVIDYDPDHLKAVIGGEKLTYDEYLEIQKKSAGKIRSYFQKCYHECASEFKGQIEKLTHDRVCFTRIYVEGMYADGTFFDGKEDHVWMDLAGFEDFKKGDSVSFFAEVYCYLKTGNGKSIDFGLRNPVGIKRIEKYELPSDEELFKQGVDLIACDNCYLNEQCSHSSCVFRKSFRGKTR